MNHRDIQITEQDKGGKAVVMDNELYNLKMHEAIEKCNLEDISEENDIIDNITIKFRSWYKSNSKQLKKWKNYFEFKSDNPENKPKFGKNYGLLKDHKPDKPLRLITSTLGTTLEKLGVFIQAYLKPVAKQLPHRLDDVHSLNKILIKFNQTGYFQGKKHKIKSLHKYIFIKIDAINMYPSIDNIFGVTQVSHELKNFRKRKHNIEECKNWPKSHVIIDGLKIALYNNVSKFGKEVFRQNNGSTMGPTYAPDYSDIAMARYEDIYDINPQI